MAEDGKKKVREFQVDSTKVQIDKDGIRITDPELVKLIQDEGLTEVNSGQSNVYVAVKY